MAGKKAPVATWKKTSNLDKNNSNHTALKAIGRIVRKLRQVKGLTQKELATLVEISQNHLSNIENGVKEPGILILARISNRLQVPIDLIMLPALEPSAQDQAKRDLANDLRDFVNLLFEDE